MSTESQVSTQVAPPQRASHKLALFLGMEQNAMLDTIKAQCFKGNPANISDAQLAAFVSIANEMGVNPLLPGMLYAYPSQGAIVPMMGPDAVFKKLTEHPDVDSWETTVYPEDVTLAPTHATTKIYRKGSDRPLSYTALLSEWKVGSNPNWGSRPRHMLGLRSLKQAARQIIHGIPFDEDERKISELVDVTGSADEAPKVDRPAPPPRQKKGAAAVAENPAQPAANPKEVVAVLEEDKPKATAPAQSDAAQVAADMKAREAKLAEAAKPVETPAAAAIADFAKTTQRTSLKPEEKYSTVARVTEFRVKEFTVAGKKVPSVQAVLSGGFQGEVMHFGGATAVGTKDGVSLVALPAWQLDAPVKIDLIGAKRGDGHEYVKVVAIELEAKPATPDSGGDEF